MVCYMNSRFFRTVEKAFQIVPTRIQLSFSKKGTEKEKGREHKQVSESKSYQSRTR